MLEHDDESVPDWSGRFTNGLRLYCGSMFFHFGTGMAALCMVALVSFIIYRMMDGWTAALDLCFVSLALLMVIVISYVGNALNLSFKPDAYREFVWACQWEEDDEDLMDGVPNGVLMSASARFNGGTARSSEIGRG